jgi:hypothetical protein
VVDSVVVVVLVVLVVASVGGVVLGVVVVVVVLVVVPGVPGAAPELSGACAYASSHPASAITTNAGMRSDRFMSCSFLP